MGTLSGASIVLSVAAQLANALDIGTANYPMQFSPNFVFTPGSGAGQANILFSDIRTLTASSNEDLDLNGTGLTDAFGATIGITKLKGLIVVSDPANVNDVVVGAAAANGVFSMFNASTSQVKVKPGGMFVLIAPDANGYAVTAATADQLRITNGGAGTSVNYTVVLIGA